MSLSKKSKRILLVLLALIIAAFGMYKYAYKPHKTTESLATDFVGNSTDFLSKIQDNSDKWQNKVVQLTGKITSKDPKGITLNTQIYCQFRPDFNTTSLQKGDEITLKGQIIGYDDLLEELKLNQCIIIK